MYNFDTVLDRTTSDCEKYGSCQRIFGRSDIIPLWVADTDFRSADFIIDKLRERVEHGVFGYTYRSDEYHRAIQGWVARRGGWNIQTDWLAYSAGVVVGVTFAMTSCTKEGDGVLIQQPVYHPFAIITNANNRTVVNNELINTEHGYEIDFKDFEQKLQSVRAFILCNPHNPTGRSFTESELRRMGDLCVKYNVRIISDEIHSDFVFAPNRHIHIASLSPEIASQTITFIAPSKSFNLAGLTTAVAIASNTLVLNEYKKEMAKIHLDTSNIFGITALREAYTHGDQWMDQMKNYLKGNIDFVLNFLAKELPSIKCHKPDATYLLWLDFSQWGMTQDELNHFLVDRARLGMSSGTIFGKGGNGFQRMNIGAPRSVIAQALEQLKVAAAELNNTTT